MRFRRGRRRGSTCCARKWSSRTRGRSRFGRAAPPRCRIRRCGPCSRCRRTNRCSSPARSTKCRRCRAAALDGRRDAVRHPRHRPAARSGRAAGLARQRRAEADRRVHGQPPVPGRRRSTACSTARTGASSSVSPSACRSSTRRPSPPAGRRDGARAPGRAQRQRGARQRAARAGVGVDRAGRGAGDRRDAARRRWNWRARGSRSPRSPTRTA